MKKSYYLWTGILALALASSIGCNNQVDLTAPYQVVTVVYGLLNQKDSAQYIRIQKAFLTNGNALVAAQVPDSIYFKPEDLVVRLVRLQNHNQPLDSVTLLPTPNMPKEPGIFANEGHYLFASNAPLNTNNTYQLKIYNLKSGKLITSHTPLVYYNGEFFKTPGAGSVNFNSPLGTGYTIRFYPAYNAVIYQPIIVFHFTRVNMLTGESKPDSVTWTLGMIQNYNPAEDVIEYNLPQNSFYRFIASQFQPDPNEKRVIGWLTFKCWAGTLELDTYIEVNKPSIGLIQEKPAYTNLTNAYGLFAARTWFVKTFVPLSEQSKDTLILGTYTKNLGFSKQ
ncbi:MAG: hypothetical protein N2110_04615 [Flavobacteriales bacterium]|nr:hypothetical protein [Flavobacteriales bacterium]MCX7768292.1 hypothetical protein [Flavobacteriales bacterium]MDW8409920.1 hypothetical protein [Flavobacteriales bacterium]